MWLVSAATAMFVAMARAARRVHKAGRQRKRTERFGKNSRKRQEPGDVHCFREKVHRATESVTPKPANRLLSPMWEHDEGQGEPSNQGRPARAGLNDAAEELRLSA